VIGAFNSHVDLTNARNVTGSKQQCARSFELPKERDLCSDGRPIVRGTDFGLRKQRRGHMTKLNKKTEAVLLAAKLVNVLKGIALNPESEDADKLRAVELILHLMDDVPALLDKLSETETPDMSPEAETSEE
jgi:hypothetical protein